MNEVKCGYTFFFLDDDTRLFDRACDLWVYLMRPQVHSIRIWTEGAYIQKRRTCIWKEPYTRLLCVCVCAVYESGAQTTRPQVHSINIWKESAYVQKRRIYIYKRAVCSSSVCACACACAWAWAWAWACACAYVYVRVRMRVCIDWYWLPVFRINLVRGPSNKQITYNFSK